MRRPIRTVLFAGVLVAAVAGPVGTAAADGTGTGSGAVVATAAKKPADPGYAAPSAATGKVRGASVVAPKPLRPANKRHGPQTKPNGPDPQIVGGGLASYGEYPYFVSLQWSSGGTGDYFCGGSLLSSTKVLTAAHCVSGRSPADLQVTIGGTTLVGGDVGVVRNISAIAVHPGWNSATRENDVAILTLATPITRDDYTVQWLRLAEGNELGLVDPGDTSTVIGHGAIYSGGPSSNELLEVAVPIQSDATMADPSRYGTSFYPATMVGAGPLAGGQDSCQGDSGGPLLITSTPQDIEIGDVSWGWGCAAVNLPGVYGELYQGSLASFVNSQVSRPANDKFGNATVLTGIGGAAYGDNTNATVDPGEPNAEASVWYTWTPTESGPAQIAVNQHGFDSEVAVYTGSSVTGLTMIGRNDDANGTLQSQLQFTAVAGTTYRIQVDGFAFDYGPFWLSYGVNRPGNDTFTGATVLTGAASLPLIESNSRATGEAGEPSQYFGSAASTLWYSWTAPETGTARISTFGSAIDTTLGVYTGAAVSSLSAVAGNDDYNGTLQSMVTFPVTAGTVYRIQLGGYAGQRGTVGLQFAVNPEPNDTYQAGTALTAGAGVLAGSNLRAIAEPGEPNLGSPPDTSVWYHWTAPVTGTYLFTTAGSSFDTVLASATGPAIGALTLVASNDDFGGLQSQIEFAATAGTVYHLWIDGWGGSRGTIQFLWTRI